MSRDTFLKIISVVFASSITIFSSLTFKREISTKYRVKVESVSENIILSPDSTKYVEVNLECPHLISENLVKRPKEIKIDLKGERYSSVQIDVDEIKIDKPALCKIKEINPKTIYLNLERKISKELEVVPDIVGRVDDKYSVSVTVVPKYVKAVGPENELKGKNKAYTEMIDIQGKMQDFSLEVPLYKINNSVNFFPQVVTVFVKIREKE
jgi:hypothetical protein